MLVMLVDQIVIQMTIYNVNVFLYPLRDAQNGLIQTER